VEFRKIYMTQTRFSFPILSDSKDAFGNIKKAKGPEGHLNYSTQYKYNSARLLT